MHKHYPFIFFFLFSFTAFSQQSLEIDAKNQRHWTQIKNKKTNLSITGLHQGHLYEVSANSINCPVLIGNTALKEVYHFLATSSIQSIELQKECSNETSFWLSISDLNAKVKVNKNQAEAVIQVANNLTAEDLIKGVLIGNNCSIDMNITKHGQNIQFGTFANGQSSVGFDSGIIISTGHINNAPGPNNSGGKGTNVPGDNTDTDLSKLSKVATHDAAVIEFDFTPVTDQISFEYVFASEEYCEFVNDDYNDIFGFFISGPGINGTMNIARVPGSGDVVSIDNINHLKNSIFFNPNSGTCNGYTNKSDIQFDGFTKPLIAMATVIPCETYHIKLAIADVGDGIYDSAVFLKAGSFSASDIVNVTPSNSLINVKNSYEGCNNGHLVFDRSCSNNINVPITFDLNILSSSTAQKGIDYTAFPETFTLPAGVAQDSILIEAINDNLPEGDETIVIEISGQYPCYKPVVTVTISDPVALEATGIDTSLCTNTSATFKPMVTGGIAPFVYDWNDGSSTESKTHFCANTSILVCEVTDFCGTKNESFFNIKAIPLPSGTMSGDTTLCEQGVNTTIQLDFTGTKPWEVVIQKDGLEFFTKQYNEKSSSFDVNQAGQYSLKSISSYGCEGNVKGSALINNTTLDAAFEHEDLSCFESQDGRVLAQAIAGKSPYQYLWSNAMKTANIEDLEAGSYSFTITDADGCTAAQLVPITQPDLLIFSVTELTHTNCYEPNGGSITTLSDGGTMPYVFSWSQNENVSNPANLTQGIYHATITDSHGCTDTLIAEIQGDFEKPITLINAPNIINCFHPKIELIGNESSLGIDFTHLWKTNGGHFLSDTNVPNLSIDLGGSYTLTTTNIKNGCTSSDTVMVLTDKTAPLIQVGEPKELNCTDTTATLGLLVMADNHKYQWNSPMGHFVSSRSLPQVIADKTGIYTLLVIDTINGCQSIDSVEVTSITTYPETASISVASPSCLGNDGLIEIASVIGGSLPLMYSFDGGLTFYTEPELTKARPGTHHIVIQDLYGCEYHDSVSLHTPIPPSLSVTPDFFIELGDEINLEAWSNQTALELDTILWTPNQDPLCSQCFDPLVSPLFTTQYHLKIVDSLHCEANATVKVYVQDPTVYIPNAFAPESGYGNDQFFINGNPDKVEKIKDFRIYDRWGSQVFVRQDISIGDTRSGWDGTYRGKLVAQGVYVYYAKIELINGKQLEYSGNVTLIR